MTDSARILVVDNYDSFVYTIVGYLKTLGATIDVVRNDAIDPAAPGVLDGYDGVLIRIRCQRGYDSSVRSHRCADVRRVPGSAGAR